MRRTDALIVGGGPAGAAAALRLAALGHAPELIERERAPRDVVCGGFLGWDALALLRRIGVDAAALGARPIERVRLIGAGRTVEARLPHAAAGLSRRTLDTALIDAATRGSGVRRGVVAREIDPVRRVVRINEEEIAADALLLATGKHDLRGAARRGVGKQGAVGLRSALPASASLRQALDGVVELHLFDGGYAGLLLQEDGSANLCLSVERDWLAAGGVAALIAALAERNPVLGDRIGSVPHEWAAIAGVPYGWRAKVGEPGLFRLGDQAAVIASLMGDGIAIALASGIGAADALHTGGPAAAPAWQRAFSARAARPLRIAEALRWLAGHGVGRRAALTVLGAMPALARGFAGATRITAPAT